MDGQPFKSVAEIADSLGLNQQESMRDRIVPMIAAALSRTPLLGMDLIGWDMMVIPMADASLLIGVAIGVRGFDLVGPGKEIMQFRPFTGWKPSQDEVDEIVEALVVGLREARAQQQRNLPRVEPLRELPGSFCP